MLTLVHVVDTALARVFSNNLEGEQHVYDEHTRDDEKYLLDIAEEIRAIGIAVEIAVITSYSIHYTKLYDLVRWGIADSVMNAYYLGRITSYNVCYTKLLRIARKLTTTISSEESRILEEWISKIV